MKSLFERTASFWSDDSAVTAIEYALIAALIVVAIAATVSALGVSLKDMFNTVSSCFPSGGC
jgi:pilus assembly protein Flp/PilA